MRSTRTDLALTLALLAVVVVMLLETLAMSPVARRVPEPVLWIVLPLLLAQALGDLVPAVGRRMGAYSGRSALLDARPFAGEAIAAASRGEGGNLTGILWAAGLPAMVMIAGILPGSVLYVLVYLRVRAGLAWGSALATGAGLAAGAYVLLERLLGLTLHRGLFPWP